MEVAILAAMNRGTPIVIVGAGGFGREVLDIIDAINQGDTGTYDFLGFVDDGTPDERRLSRLRAVHIGGSDSVKELPTGCAYVVAVANPEVRASLTRRMDAAGLTATTLIHPSATVGRDVEIGPGSIVCAGVRITTNIRIGRHVILNLNVTVGHDTTLEDFVSINPLVAVSGEVVLEWGATMGTGSSVNQGLRIGARTTVGAGASVVKSQPSDVVVVGVPAKPLQRK